MGVTGLWTVVAPTARPTQLATLNRKRLAVDASIWIYQFLKAVRDKEGNALRNSHVIGFFRRICKLLYFGIKPVFVFDGAAPLLKRETVRGRARRREGRREDAARTAGKLLGMQMQRAAEEEEGRRRAETERTLELEEELPPVEEMVYVDELGMSRTERQRNRQFKKKDQYHLPDLDVSIESMGAPNDPRIMSQTELEEYAKQFHSGEDINFYDFNKIDFESPFFMSLPASDRYNILNAARLRSRLRMGYSKEQLDDMFPDRMAFSRFQIERVRERNELTQRLMHVNGMADDFLDQGGRIAGEKGKEYVLVKNDGVEGGWALGVVSNKGRHKADAIDLDEEVSNESQEDEDDGDGFEDIAIEGLNRLPTRWIRNQEEADYDSHHEKATEGIAQKRRAVYDARQKAAARGVTRKHPDSQPEYEELFVQQENPQAHLDEAEELFEDVNMNPNSDEQDDLQLAIELSLQKVGTDQDRELISTRREPRTLRSQEIGNLHDAGFNQTSSYSEDVVQPHPNVESDGEAEFDLQAALAETRKSKHKPHSRDDFRPSSTYASIEKRFDGPLPFESLNLGQSLLGKKKAEKIEQDQAGGFQRITGEEKPKPAPLPSWFAAKEWTTDMARDGSDEAEAGIGSGPEDPERLGTLMQGANQEVVDVDESPSQTSPAPIVIDSSEDEADIDRDTDMESKNLGQIARDEEDKFPEAAEATPVGGSPGRHRSPDLLINNEVNSTHSGATTSRLPGFVANQADIESLDSPHLEMQVDWSETDDEEVVRLPDKPDRIRDVEVAGADATPAVVPAPEDDDIFEDVDVSRALRMPQIVREASSMSNDAHLAVVSRYLIADDDDAVKTPFQPGAAGSAEVGDQADFSDSDEELMRQMVTEAEEHARFASSLNNTKTTAEAARDYENELKQLRNQQKKDRRDADEVTQIMVQECQSLLRLFGLPYITAPMEAEAQCAELVSLGLVDGIVTDDSDIFLFGGTRVYKNMFNAAKFVECYLASDLEKEYALDRKKLIRFAHLLGSDYTEGIPGVGPVTALEILTEFDNLEKFRDWALQVQMGQLEGNIATPFRRKFRKQAQKMFLPPAFPDTRVDHAYLHPDVDSDPSGFEWGVPDLDALRGFLMATIGWSQERTDEVLVPVIRDMNRRELEGTQTNITRFFEGGVGVGGTEATAPRNRNAKSGRMEKAFGRLKSVAERKKYDAAGGNQEAVREASQDQQVGEKEQTSSINIRRRPKSKRHVKSTTNPTIQEETSPGDDVDDSGVTLEVVPRKKRRRKAAAC